MTDRLAPTSCFDDLRDAIADGVIPEADREWATALLTAGRRDPTMAKVQVIFTVLEVYRALTPITQVH